MRNTDPKALSMEEAGSSLLSKALDPRTWGLPTRRVTIENSCRVGSIQVCATVDVTPTLETYLRVSFRGPELSPMAAAEMLEAFTSTRFEFVPNAEWMVEIDARSWIHFSRRYTNRTLRA